MIRLRTILRRFTARLSREGIVGLGLLALSLAFYLLALRPAEARLDALHASLVSLHEKLRNAAHAMRTDGGTPAEQLATYYAFFPPQTSTPNWLDKIYKAARDQNLQLDRGDYRATRETPGRLVRYRITLPVKGTYFQIRQFLAAMLTQVPIASLDQVSFERQKVGDAVLEAKIRLSLYLRDDT